MKTHIKLYTVSILISFLFVVGVSGQNVMPSDYKADQVLKSNARVNPTSLAMELSIPVGGYKGRGGSGLPISFNYSSKVWQMENTLGGPFEASSGNVTPIAPVYGKRTAAGWSSSLASPKIDFPANVYEGSHTGIMYLGQMYQPVSCSSNCTPQENYFIYYVKRVQVVMPDGSSHEFRQDDTIYSYGTWQSVGTMDLSGTYLSVDGTRMRLVINSGTSSFSSATLFLPDGGRYLFGTPGTPWQAEAFIDRSGNKMTYDATNRRWMDTLGRVIDDPMPVNWAGQISGQGSGTGAETSHFPGVGTDTLDVQFSWVYLKDLSTSASVIDDPDNTSQTLYYGSDYYCSGAAHTYRSGEHLFGNPDPSITWVCSPQSTRFNPVVLSSITLANGQSYQFRYNAFGEITKIIYPTGGYERFKYAPVAPVQPSDASYEQANRGVVDRWVSPKGDGTDEIHWQYSDTGATTYAPDGTRTEQSVYTESAGTPQPFGFGDAKTGRPYEERTYSSSNALLLRKLTGYETTGALSGGYPDATRDLRPNKEISIAFEPGGSYALASMTETVYDSNSDPQYFASLNPTQIKKYDYVVVGASTAASANIATASGWFTGVNPATVTEMDYLYDPDYKARNLSGLVAETRVKTSGGTVKAKSQITYDETSYQTTSSGTMPTAASGSWVDPTGSGEFGSTVGSKRGLPTTVRSFYDIANGYYVETHSVYDQYGNLRKSRDGRGNDTEMLYDDDYAFAYPTSVLTPIPDSNGTYGSSTALTSSTVYDYDTGLPTSATDANGQTTEMEYVDPLFRNTKVTAPNGAQTITEYGVSTSASTRWVKVKSQIDADRWNEAYTWFDGLGRTSLSQKVDANADDVFVATCYDSMGRVQKTSHPVRSASAPTCSSSLEWTTPTYDDLGRTTVVTTPDAAHVDTAYSLATSGSQIGTVVTATDQAGRLRRSVTNALGQLIRVDEPDGSSSTGSLGSVSSPNQGTVYAYDLLNNLTTVTQGSQTRSFTYDALSRLTQATNPESGTIKYTYDANSNLKTKWDARGIKTIFDYDTLNRVWKRCYKSVGTSLLGATTCATATSETAEPNTPDVTIYYDNVTNAKGKLTKVSSLGSTTEYTGFDILGRVTSHKQTTDGGDPAGYTTSYTYNLAGALLEETYPSTRVVKNVLDQNGDLALTESKKNSSSGYWHYADSFTYNAAGAVTSVQLGNGRWESTVFNSRLQPTEIKLGATNGTYDLLRLQYSYGDWGGASVDATKNNGNIAQQTITVPNSSGNADNFVATQKYYYDSLNRIDDSTEDVAVNGGTSSQSWRQDFSYDRYGNRGLVEASTTTIPRSCGAAPSYSVCPDDRKRFNPAVSASNNRLSAADGYQYDPAGNTAKDPQSRKFTYDAENKQTKVETLDANGGVTGTVGEYSYDGDGRRVRKYVPSTGETTVFVYDAAGKQIAEYSTIVAPQTQAKVNYLTSDHLGSPRVNTDASGAVIARHDYHPFGEEIVAGRTQAEYTGDTVRKQFTGYERDNEIELDFAQARFYSSRLARFYSVDPENAGADTISPQTWNSYSYAGNNPVIYVDPYGTDYLFCDQQGNCHQRVSDKQFRAAQSAGDLTFKDGRIYDKENVFRGTYQYVPQFGGDPPASHGQFSDLWKGLILLGGGSATAGSGATGGAVAGAGILGGILGSSGQGGTAGQGGTVRGGVTLPANASIDLKTLTHIIEEHNWNNPNTSKKGRFSPSTTVQELKNLIKDATQNGTPSQSFGGRIVFEYNCTKPIGVSREGHLTTRIRVVMESTGRIITAFPIQ